MLGTNVEIKGSYVQIVRFVARCAFFFSAVQYSMLSCLIEGRTVNVGCLLAWFTNGLGDRGSRIQKFRFSESRTVSMKDILDNNLPLH